ncbi:DNA repair protein RecO [Sodalis sp. CWE]|uniref:DNA repair protein RecO n=1 Tax=Sodalis sp. CWE TaxID=2803816 RepID=UPI001C7D8EAF|nr:DNA repair protein RecO [Sodalis sp. CWE]MBX4181024.1 DNA repair protein RecO [Sodalis sp. CWE]
MEVWQRAFVLQTHFYGERGLILDLFTEHQGRTRVLAKNVYSQYSIFKGIFQLFTPLLICWKGRSALKTMQSAEPISLSLPLSGKILYCGLYVNELLSRVLLYEADYSTLFYDYLYCLQSLAKTTHSPEPILRKFEFSLLNYLGYGVDFLHCADSGEPIKDSKIYSYQEERGFVTADAFKNYCHFNGYELQAIAEQNFFNSDILQTAKRFIRLALKPYLGNKLLKSYELFH